jgi:hypothetical protein
VAPGWRGQQREHEDIKGRGVSMVVGVGAHRRGVASRTGVEMLWVVGSCWRRGPHGGQR